jgi:hypothetical protein
VRWLVGQDKVTQPQLFAALQQSVESFEAVEPYPHYPPLPRHYYLHPKTCGGAGKALRELVGRFNPATDVDHDLIVAFFLTLFWGGTPGQRPAWLVTTDEEEDRQRGRGSGKSTLAKMGACLTGGLIQASPRDEMSKVITRLLTPGARGKRVVLIDNIKSLKFSWGELEGLITSDTISGHQMYEGEGQRPNTLVWCLTVNGASLSKDMAQRTIPILIRRPAHYSGKWEDDTRALINARRWEIVGDCLDILRQPGKTLENCSRWGAWEEGVLSRVADPSECQQTIAERQAEMDDDSAEAALVREAFVAELRRRGHDPDGDAVWIPAREAAAILNDATNERYAVNRAGVYLKTLTIPELRKSDSSNGKGWAWRGKNAGRRNLVAIGPPPGSYPTWG